MTKVILSTVCALLLAACAAVSTPKTPEQMVFSAKATYNAALQTALVYESLSRCGDAVPSPCSDADVVAVIRKADTAAFTALDLAEDTVRSEAISALLKDQSVSNALDAADAFVQILTELEVM